MQERNFMRKNSIKNTRINNEVQRELSNIIRGEIKDPRIHPMTSVVAGEVAPAIRRPRRIPWQGFAARRALSAARWPEA